MLELLTCGGCGGYGQGRHFHAPETREPWLGLLTPLLELIRYRKVLHEATDFRLFHFGGRSFLIRNLFNLTGGGGVG